jgi:CarD family transcriptional regulator
MESFKIGDKIIYPNQGLGVIEDIQKENFYGEDFKVFHVRILSNNTLVLIPSSNAEEIGIRKPVNVKIVSEIFVFMKTGIIDVTMNWKGRYKEHQDLMKSGNMIDVAYVLKSLFYLNLLKPLSFREKKMMEKALELVVMEISEVSEAPLQDIEKKILDSLTVCFKDIESRVDS